MHNLSKIGQETKKLQKIGNGVIVTSFLKIAQQFIVCEYFLLISIDVPSFKLIEGQIKELQGLVSNTPRAKNDQKSPGRIGLRFLLTSVTNGSNSDKDAYLKIISRLWFHFQEFFKILSYISLVGINAQLMNFLN